MPSRQERGEADMQRKRRGQSTAEYAIVLSVVIAAIVGMQLYVKRGMQGKFKQVSDYYAGLRGNNNVLSNAGTQYEPYYIGSNITSNSNTSGTEGMALGGTFTKNNLNEASGRTGTMNQGSNTTQDDAWATSN